MGITTNTARRVRGGPDLPAVCSFKDVFIKSGANAGFYICLSANVWTGPFDTSTDSGDVVGPASSTDNAIARYDLTTGKLLQNSAVIIADTTGNISGPQKVTVGVAGTATGALDLKGTTSGTVTVKPADAAGTWSLTLPANDGDAGQYLQTDGAGVSSWQTVTAGISGSTGATDNRVLRADGTGGSTLQNSAVAIDDTGTVIGINGSTTVPAFAFADGVTGLAFDGFTDIGILIGGTRLHRIDSTKYHVLSNTAKFAGGTFDGDVALERDAAARWKITDNGAGLGDLKVRKYLADQTITAGGTTGNQTINKAAGTVNVAASGTTVTVTSDQCTTSSTVFAVIRTNDATATIKNVVPGAGSFVITLTAAATAEISIGWMIVN